MGDVVLAEGGLKRGAAVAPRGVMGGVVPAGYPRQPLGRGAVAAAMTRWGRGRAEGQGAGCVERGAVLEE